MGVQMTELLPLKEVSLAELSGKVIAIDTHIYLYQFLATIRQRDGTLLMDSRGNITSHLSGLFFRTVKLLENNIRPIFVFDGKPPELKWRENERRKALKKEAEALHAEAVAEEDTDAMRKYASRSVKITKEIISDAKKLIAILGLPIIEAPSEGEAQAAHIAKKGDAFAVSSQDADSLLFGTPKLIRNLSIFGKRKRPNKLAYEEVKPEIVHLDETLNSLGIDHEQLIALSILVGTDYNPSGIKGIGPKTALKLVKAHRRDFDNLFREVKWDEHSDLDWHDIFDIIKNIPVTDDYHLEWKSIDENSLKKFLVEEHDFSEERIMNAIKDFTENKKQKSQSTLSKFF